ncbi:hypothetical protein [Streptomyces sp. NBC_01304]|uniref:hypothetical protein n=1 Tax=Streptomyces sp. NBC_01304 TaxID=2903818 RepID=UPI002E0F0B4A|nr:hypothetical protein OG430_48965 [Streptomyces sp. NBC_01304]
MQTRHPSWRLLALLPLPVLAAAAWYGTTLVRHGLAIEVPEFGDPMFAVIRKGIFCLLGFAAVMLCGSFLLTGLWNLVRYRSLRALAVYWADAVSYIRGDSPVVDEAYKTLRAHRAQGE